MYFLLYNKDAVWDHFLLCILCENFTYTDMSHTALLLNHVKKYIFLNFS